MTQISWTDKKVLVTGGAGFVGSHLVETLLKAGSDVTVVDNFVTGQQRNITEVQSATGKDFQVINADVSQPADQFLPADFIPDVVLHFASPASPPRYQAIPIETYQVNTWGTHYLLDWLKRHAPQATFLFASTSEVYGNPQVHPQPESYWGNVNPNGPRSCYDEAKRLGETICGTFGQLYQLDVRIVRIFNTYGPRMDLADGRVIPNFIHQALTQQPFTIFGEGTQTRSYCFVTDLVNGILTFAGAADLAGQTINLGNPEEFTILETAKILAEISETPFNFEHKPLPGDDPERRRPDITKAQQLLRWHPKVSFVEGLQKTIESFR